MTASCFDIVGLSVVLPDKLQLAKITYWNCSNGQIFWDACIYVFICHNFSDEPQDQIFPEVCKNHFVAQHLFKP